MASANTNLKLSVFHLTDAAQPGEASTRMFNLGMLALIVANILAVIFETEERLYQSYQPLFDGFEYFSIVVFTVEYALRLWACTAHPKYRHPLLGRLRYAMQPMALIDLLSILPFFGQLFFAGAALVDLRFMRAVRLFRFFRLAKMGRYSRSLARLIWVLRKKKRRTGHRLVRGLDPSGGRFKPDVLPGT